LLLTTVFVALAFFKQLGKIAGGIFVFVFAIYVASIGFAIYRGLLDAPEGSDDESGYGSSDDEADEESILINLCIQRPPLSTDDRASHRSQSLVRRVLSTA
jgi:hypothetical protein